MQGGAGGPDAGTSAGGVCDCDGKPTAAGDSFPVDLTVATPARARRAATSPAREGASGAGAKCGGLLGLGCAKGEYCNFPIETMCGSGDQQGTCDKIPEVCDTLYKAVCGCDGKTYPNDCNAAMAGQSVISEGACK